MTIHVLEHKGGSGQLGHAYGYPQGSPEWAVESAKRVLRSQNATLPEKAAAEAILRAAIENRLEVHVVRTSHVLGEPTAAVLEQSARSTDATAKLASATLKELATTSARAADGVALGLDDAARGGSNGGGKALRTAAKAGAVVGIALDAGLRVHDSVQTERQFAAGKLSLEQREVSHAKNAAGMAGGWAGAVAGAELGAVGGGAAGSFVAPGPGTAVGAAAGGIAGGIGGYFGGEAAAESAAEWSVRKVHAAGTSISGTANKAWSATSENVSGAGRWIWKAKDSLVIW